MTKIFPAIDIINGSCVRLTQGKFSQVKSYSQSPLETALYYEKLGAKYLHIVDLDAAVGKANNTAIIEEIISNTGLSIQVGGGIKSESMIERYLLAGADRVVLGSLAIKNPKLVKSLIMKFGADKITIGADSMDSYIATHGWKKKSTTTLEAFIDSFSDFFKGGLTPKEKNLTFLCTEISKDGTLQGTDSSFYARLQETFPEVNIIVSGGIKDLDEVKNYVQKNIYAVIVGKALFEQKVNPKELFQL